MATVQVLPPHEFPLSYPLALLSPSPKGSEPKQDSSGELFMDQDSNNLPPYKPSSSLFPKSLQTKPITSIRWTDRIYLLQDQKVSAAHLEAPDLVEVLDRKKRRSPPTTLDHSSHGFVLGLPHGKIEVWDVNGTQTSTFDLENRSAVRSTAALGNFILAGSDHLSLFDVRQQPPVWIRLNARDTPIPSVSFVSNHLLMSGHQEHFSIWDTRSLNRPLAQPQVSTTSHHWCGSKMISTGNHVVRLWELTSTHLHLRRSRPLEDCSQVYLGPQRAAAIVPEKLYTCTTSEKITSYQTLHANPPSAINPEKNTIVTQTESGYLRFFNF